MAKATTEGTDETRDVPPLSMRAQLQPDTANEVARTIEMVWTTGARVLRGGFFTDPYWEELSLDPKHVRMSRLNNGAPVLDSHDMHGGVDAVLGVVESARLEKGRGVAVVRFAKDDPAADAAWRKISQGILQNVSVGYRVYKLEKTEEVTDKVPVARVVDWEPFELSVVPSGADDGAGFRTAAQTRSAPNPCIFVDPHRKEATAMPEPIVAPPTAADPSVEDIAREGAARRQRDSEAAAAAMARATEDALKADRARATEIRAIIRSVGADDATADALIKSGATLDQVRKSALETLTARSDGSAPANHFFEAGEDKRDKFVRGGVASILQRSGLVPMMTEAKKHATLAENLRDVSTDAGEFRGMRLIDLARTSLERQGQSTRGLHGEQLVKRALQFRGDAGMNTTSDFAILLETAVNKIFLGQYALAPITWRRWCGVKSVQDFRTSTFYRPGSFSVLDTVTEAGEVKHKNIPDGSKATLTPATKGNIIGISRRSIVNDDLGVFRDNAAQLGDAAAATIEADCFAMITANSGLGPTQSDSQPLFHANRANIGATGAMSVTTLDSARAKIKLQKDVSANRFLNLVPRVWLGPVELGGLARQMNASQFDPSKTTNIPNIVNGMFADIVDVGQLSAVSATRHYLLADPSVAPVFVVGFLDGSEAPRIETDNSFEYDGLQMKVILDYGTAVIDYRGAATSAGA